MKQKQFTDEQIVAILQEAAKGEMPIIEICRRHESPRRPFTPGAKSSAGCKRATCSASKNWKGRTPGSSVCWPRKWSRSTASKRWPQKTSERSPEEGSGTAPGSQADVLPAPGVPFLGPVSLDGALLYASPRR